MGRDAMESEFAKSTWDVGRVLSVSSRTTLRTSTRLKTQLNALLCINSLCTLFIRIALQLHQCIIILLCYTSLFSIIGWPQNWKRISSLCLSRTKKSEKISTLLNHRYRLTFSLGSGGKRCLTFGSVGCAAAVRPSGRVYNSRR